MSHLTDGCIIKTRRRIYEIKSRGKKSTKRSLAWDKGLPGWVYKHGDVTCFITCNFYALKSLHVINVKEKQNNKKKNRKQKRKKKETWLQSPVAIFPWWGRSGLVWAPVLCLCTSTELRASLEGWKQCCFKPRIMSQRSSKRHLPTQASRPRISKTTIRAKKERIVL